MAPHALSQHGYIELICGCMFSGKSKLLLRRLADARKQGLEVIAFKHASDDRYSATCLVTHDGGQFEAIPVKSPHKFLMYAKYADLIAVDEVQFFGPELADVTRQCADQGKIVLLSGLDLDSWGLPFGAMPEIEAACDKITRLEGTCSICGKSATHTQRITPIKGRMIGGKGNFEPRCSKHFSAPPLPLRR
jgi:thymidine kinase